MSSRAQIAELRELDTCSSTYSTWLRVSLKLCVPLKGSDYVTQKGDRHLTARAKHTREKFQWLSVVSHCLLVAFLTGKSVIKDCI